MLLYHEGAWQAYNNLEQTGLMDDGVKSSLLGLWMALFIVFAGRKFTQPMKVHLFCYGWVCCASCASYITIASIILGIKSFSLLRVFPPVVEANGSSRIYLSQHPQGCGLCSFGPHKRKVPHWLFLFFVNVKLKSLHLTAVWFKICTAEMIISCLCLKDDIGDKSVFMFNALSDEEKAALLEKQKS